MHTLISDSEQLNFVNIALPLATVNIIFQIIFGDRLWLQAQKPSKVLLQMTSTGGRSSSDEFQSDQIVDTMPTSDLFKTLVRRPKATGSMINNCADSNGDSEFSLADENQQFERLGFHWQFKRAGNLRSLQLLSESSLDLPCSRR